MRLRTLIRNKARAAIAVAALAAALTPCAAETPAEVAIVPDGMDWNAVLFDATVLNVKPAPDLSLPKPLASGAASWSRTDRPDGSASVTVKRTLPAEWDTKVGIDLGLPPSAERDTRPDIFSPGLSQDRGSGSAWANMTLPGASLEARVETQGEQEKLGTKLSKSVPVGGDLSVTLQNGFSVTHAQPGVTAGMPAAAANTAIQTAALAPVSVYSTDRAARLQILPTGTSFSAGATTSSADEKWLRTFSAKQKLLGPLSVTGSVSETASGDLNKSLSAGFKRNW